jgi:hypothetical protein
MIDKIKNLIFGKIYEMPINVYIKDLYEEGDVAIITNQKEKRLVYYEFGSWIGRTGFMEKYIYMPNRTDKVEVIGNFRDRIKV